MTEEKFWEKFENSKVCISFKNEEEFDSFEQKCNERGIKFNFKARSEKYCVNYEQYMKGNNALHMLDFDMFQNESIEAIKETARILRSLASTMGIPKKIITCVDRDTMEKIFEIVNYSDVFEKQHIDERSDLIDYLETVKDELERHQDIIECFGFTIKFNDSNKGLSCCVGKKMDVFNMLMNSIHFFIEEDDDPEFFIEAIIKVLQEMKKEFKKDID